VTAKNPKFRSFVEVTRHWAAERGDQTAYTFLSDADLTADSITFAMLDRRARAIGVELRQRTRPGDRAVLVYPPGLEYVCAFLGCLYAHVIAVPAYPPDPARLHRTLPRLRAMMSDAQANVILTTSQVREVGEFLFAQDEDLRTKAWISTDAVDLAQADSWQDVGTDRATIAFLQYTSGSTASPRGVVLSHGNLLHNEMLAREGMEFWRPNRCMVSWLPPYHDMGLIGGILAPLFGGFPAVLMGPMSFLQKPLMWLQAITKYRATVSGTPNFGFDLCVRKITPEERDQLDLSSLDVLYSGAEPIQFATLRSFEEYFAPVGFKPTMFYPCYGLAEGTLIVSGGRVADPVVSRRFDILELEKHRIVPLEDDQSGSQRLVGCGRTLLDQVIAIVDPNTRKRALPDQIGEIWVSGDSVAKGYFRRPQETEHTFRATIDGEPGRTYLRTGDLGFLDGEELYITGRAKDLIIVRGRNIYPQDIETTIERCSPAMRPGCSAAFSVSIGGEERLVVVAELERRHRPDRRKAPGAPAQHPDRRATRDRRSADPEVDAFGAAERLHEAPDGPVDPRAAVRAARRAIAHELDLSVHAIVLIKAGSINKTSSGKIQRSACRAAFLNGELEIIHEDVLPLGDEGVETWDLATTRQAIETEPEETRFGILVEVVRGLVSSALRVPHSSIADDAPLVALGVDSLRATQVLASIRSAFKVDIPLTRIFEGVTVLDLAQRLQLELRAGKAGTPPLVRVSRSDLLPLSSSQARLHFLRGLYLNDASYNIVGAFRLRGHLNVHALEEALGELALRHEAFRTEVVVSREGTLQRILETARLPLTLIDRSTTVEAGRDAAYARELATLAATPIDLGKAPLASAAVVRTTEDDHMFVLVVHHIVCDGWSAGVLLEELSILYRARLAADMATLEPLPFQYVDYVAWQDQYLNGETLNALVSYWRDQLAEPPAPLRLPFEHARPETDEQLPARRLTTTLSKGILSEIQALARREGATLHNVLLAGFALLLSRYTGESDIVIGGTVVNRPLSELHRIVGFFANTLALRIDLHGDPTIEQAITAARRTMDGAQAHQSFPFEKVVEAVQPAREIGRAPLFQVLFNFLDSAMGSLSLEGLQVSPLDVPLSTARFDLTVQMVQRNDELRIEWEYAAPLFEEATLRRLAQHYQRLLSSAAAHPGVPVSALPIFGDGERAQLLRIGDSLQMVASGRTLQAAFEDRVSETPGLLAVECGHVRLTYEELDARANGLAHRLLAVGVGREERVAIVAERSVEAVIAILGVLKAGAAFLPFDPATPAARIEHVIQDANVRFVLATRGSYEPQNVLQVLWLDDERQSIADRPNVEIHPSQLAYTIYTSGSTGTPKGVLIEHATAARMAEAVATAYHVERSSRVLLFASLAFDAAVEEVFKTLSRGATLYVARRDALLGRGLIDLVSGAAITNATFPPAVLATISPAELPSLRTVVSAGEACPPSVVKRWSRSTTLINGYGPTEAVVCSSLAVCAPTDLTPPIGRALSPKKLYVLDRHMQLAPFGAIGELYIGGPDLARAYLGRPDLTAERFFPDPFSNVPGARMYRTGDRVRWRADAMLEYVGRADRQVKVRGFRIELGEIEAALHEIPGVREAAVSARKRGDEPTRLVAFVVKEEGADANAASLRTALSKRLPAHMLPSSIAIVADLPRSHTGKVDPALLAQFPDAPADAGRAYTPPRDAMEDVLASIWSEVLPQVERVGVHDNFFDLGGHSLLGAQVLGRIQAWTGAELAVRVLFEAPTIAELALRVEEALRGSAAGGPRAVAPPLRQEPRAAELQLSFAQERLWFFEQLDRDAVGYNVAGALRLRGPLDIAALERAFTDVVDRHEVLRTTYPAVDGRPTQHINDEPAFAIERGRAHAEDIGALVQVEERRPFDLTRDLPIRVKLVEVAPDDHALLVTIHHIASDGWSFAVLMREIGHFYRAHRAGRSPELAPLPVQYADYAAWQRRWLASGLGSQLEYWTERLRGIEPLRLPLDRARPTVQSFDGAVERFTIADDVAERLRRLAGQAHATLYMVLLSAFAGVLARLTGQTDIAVGTPVANRNRPETESLVGLFTNTVVLRLDLSDDPTFAELVERVKETTLGAYAHQDAPFEKVVEAIGPRRDLGMTPLFQVMFALDNMPSARLDLDALDVKACDVDGTVAKFDLTLQVAEQPGSGEQTSIAGVWEYCTALFEQETVADFARVYLVWLEAASANPSLRLSETLRGTLEDERLPERRPSHDDEPQTLLDLFERQAEASPDAVAISFDTAPPPGKAAGEQGVITYRELSASVERAAHVLAARGVGPDTVVGVVQERSPDVIVTLLAILKAGGAYVPIEPKNPRERTLGMLRDAGAKLVVADEASAVLLVDAPLPVITTSALQVETANTRPLSRPAPGNLAYVLFTSGSTGVPKGVAIEHHSAARYVQWSARLSELEPTDVILQNTAYTFDPSLPEIFGALTSGARLVLERPGGPQDIRYVADRIARERVTVIQCVPTFLRALLENADSAQLVSLRAIFSGGEAMPADLPALVRSRTQAVLYNAYGPTEVTVDATCDRVDEQGRITIGRPVPHLCAYVLDAAGEPLPRGMIGELYVGGDTLARGYVARPAETAAVFTPDPFSSTPGARMYRTGDRVRRLADGRLDYVGRVDRQVKVRGHRVELGEIEAVLASHPAVLEAAVILRRTGNDARVVGVVASSQQLEPLDVLRHVKRSLPDYMVPHAIAIVPSLPRTAGGKVDLQALETVSVESTARADSMVPTTRTERQLMELWSALLGVGQVGLHDNFFELGGDSILSIQLVARAQQVGLRLEARDVFQAQTIAELALRCDERRTRPPVASEMAMLGEVVLTPIQRWFFEQEPDGRDRWNQAVLLEIPRMDPSRIEVGLRAIIAERDAFRLRFARDVGGFRPQVVEAETQDVLHRFDLRDKSASEMEIELGFIAETLHGGIHLDTGPVVQFAYVDRGEGRPALLFAVAHHLVVDAVSWRLVLEELFVRTASPDPTHSPSVDPPPSFAAWSKAFARWAASGGAARSAARWLQLPWDATRQLPRDGEPEGVESATQRHIATLSVKDTARLTNEALARHRTTVADVLVAALAQTISAWSDARAVLFDLEGHGRDEYIEHIDPSRTVGWFTTLFPVVVTAHADPRALLLEAMDRLRTLPPLGTHYGALRYMTSGSVTRELRQLPTAEISFNYLGHIITPSGDVRHIPDPPGALRAAGARRTHLFEIDASIVDGTLRVSWGYDSGAHKPETIAKLARDFLAAVNELSRHCEATQTPLMTTADYPLAKLSPADLENVAHLVAAHGRGIEDIYAPSPIQEGILYDVLSSSGEDPYFEQVICTTGPDLDVDAFIRAWQTLLARHPILRTSFRWRGLGRTVQVVHRSVELAIEHVDLSTQPPEQAERELEAFLAADRARGFVLEQAPLVRLAIVRLRDTHRIVWSAHHLIDDGWSMANLLRELLELYASPTARLRPVPSYRELIRWLDATEPTRRPAAEDFWRATLAGFSAASRLPGDGTQLERRQGSDEETLFIEAADASTLDLLARRLKVTQNTVFTAAWALIVAAQDGRDSVVVGTTVSGRTARIPGIDSIVGPFLSTLPVRVSIPASGPIGHWLRTLQMGQAVIRQHEHSPLIDVLKWSDVRQGEPLFESLLIFENYPLASIAAASTALDVRDVQIHERTTYPLSLYVVPGERIKLRAVYDRARFSRDAMKRTLARLAETAKALAREADVRDVARSVEALTPDERATILSELGSTCRAWPGDETLVTLFEQQAVRTPVADAVRWRSGVLSYRELDERARKLARVLQRRGVGRESLVGLFLSRSAETIVAALAVMKTGAAYVPLDPSYPQARLAFMVEDARVRVVLAADRDLGWLSTETSVIDFVRDAAAIAAEPADFQSVPMRPDAAAYVVYTSGSTGQPKGVVGTHRATVNRLRWMWETFPFAAGEVHALRTSTNFVDSIWETFGPILAGTPAHLFSDAEVLDPRAFVAGLAAARVTRLVLVPSLLDALLATMPDLGNRLPALRTWTCSGEALSDELAARFHKALPSATLLNLYGSSEAAGDSTFEIVTPSLRVTLGRPIANTRCLVLDSRMMLVPPGTPGELWLGGEGLSRGYVNAPAATAERFFPDPFSDEPGRRLYRTGDRVIQMPDGRLAFLGRVDQQVKVRGMRIELGEVAAAVRSLDGVKDVVALVHTDGPTRVLVAYVARREGMPLDEASLQAEASRVLPPHMVPSTFVVLDAFPLTPNGKVDRRALPAPRSGVATSGRPVRTATEQLVAGIWSDVLGKSVSSATDDFFSLGGDSLLSMRLIALVGQATGVDVPLRSVFEARTVEAFAALIDELSADPASRLAPIPNAPRNEPLPLTLEQERMWLFDQLDPETRLPNVGGAARIRGPLSTTTLQSALDALVARHESLRTTIVWEENQVVQRVHGATSIEIESADFTGAADPLAAAEEDAGEAVRRPFDTASLPLFRVRLARIGEAEHLLTVSIHHLVADEWSVKVFVEDLGRFYAARARGTTPASVSAPLETHFADFSAWKRSRAEADATYWRKRLAGDPPLLLLPADRPRRPKPPLKAATTSLVIPAPVRAALVNVARGSDATLFMVVVAAFALVLWRQTRERDVVLGSIVMDRTRPVLQKLIGYFITTVLYRLDVRRGLSFTELVQQVKNEVLGAGEHPNVPYEELLRLRRERAGGSAAMQGLFQVAVNFGGSAMMPPLELGDGIEMTLVPSPPKEYLPFELALNVNDGESALEMELVYRTAVFDEATAKRLGEQLARVLGAVALAPDLRVEEPSLLSDAELQALASIAPESQRALPPVARVDTLFEEQVARTPNAIALVSERELTFREIDELANGFARKLLELGVGPETRVGISLSRTSWLVVALLGVLKAGATYVPLDPTYPADRLSYMLEDSGARVLVIDADPPSWKPSNVVALDPRGISRDATPVRLPRSALAAMYTIYTSGSTGRPKGVVVQHREVVNLLASFKRQLSPTERDTLLSVTSLSFDIAGLELFLPLITGARLALPAREDVVDPNRLMAKLRECRASLMQATPSTWRMLVDAGWSGGELTALCGGEALPSDLAVALVSRTRKLLNVYGPTETTIWSTAGLVEGPDVRLGHALDNTTLYVLDDQLRPVPTGVPGELFIGGLGVARGYHERADLTAERFVPSAFASEPGARLYRTGDLVRWRADGSLEYISRVDNQTKLRGFRIELGEIESILDRTPGVRQSVVVVREDVPGNQQLVAYVVGATTNGGAPEASALKTALASKLPEYMVPSAIVMLEALPLTLNGKIDRRALPPPQGVDGPARGRDDATFVQPADPLEIEVARIWAELLGISRVGALDDFFWLGGHSLLATQMLARVRTSLGIELPLSVLFTVQPTVRNVAALLREQQLGEMNDEEAAALLGDLEGLSEEEALALIAAEDEGNS
jgi:amino acid adenylation domain-containing protein/non-ribosomal peptide synthase protein (TIGR01720 family)